LLAKENRDRDGVSSSDQNSERGIRVAELANADGNAVVPLVECAETDESTRVRPIYIVDEEIYDVGTVDWSAGLRVEDAKDSSGRLTHGVPRLGRVRDASSRDWSRLGDQARWRPDADGDRRGQGCGACKSRESIDSVSDEHIGVVLRGVGCLLRVPLLIAPVFRNVLEEHRLAIRAEHVLERRADLI
jgi:hypothetical protein